MAWVRALKNGERGGFGAEHRCEKAIDRVGGANQIYRPAPAQNRAE